ncbi:MAG: sigma-70 family RNA polymerase sigma factor [Planctomycetes bacterium]|nr:sigma-70 family RNA polymerase sigma factor [Planctomycetota bacterium]
MSSRDKLTSVSLLDRIRDRDEEAWRRLVRLYAPFVASWCAHWGVRGQDADDVTQEVFHSVAKSLEAFRRDRPDDTFRGWLRVITRNKLLDHFRRLENQPAAQGGSEAYRQLEQVAQEQWPEDSAADLGSLYHRALDLVRSEFEERTWDAFWRTAVEGQATAVVAAEMGVSAAAIRKAKSRILHRLRQEVGELIA